MRGWLRIGCEKGLKMTILTVLGYLILCLLAWVGIHVWMLCEGLSDPVKGGFPARALWRKVLYKTSGGMRLNSPNHTEGEARRRDGTTPLLCSTRKKWGLFQRVFLWLRHIPPLFGHCLSVDGENRVKMRSQRGYFWPPPMLGDEQMNPKPICALPY